MSAQQVLALALRDGASFENYVAGANAEAVDRLQQALQATNEVHLLYFYGAEGSGRTHLLEAAMASCQQQHRQAGYLDLAEPGLTPAVLSDLEQFDVLCLDNADARAGNDKWERALMFVLEQCRSYGRLMLLTATRDPAHAGFLLPDLQSRMRGWGLVYGLHALSDSDRSTALKQRARNRGIELSDEVLRFVLERYPRDMRSLFCLLDKLDAASLAEQRRITIPFIKQVL